MLLPTEGKESGAKAEALIDRTQSKRAFVNVAGSKAEIGSDSSKHLFVASETETDFGFGFDFGCRQTRKRKQARPKMAKPIVELAIADSNCHPKCCQFHCQAEGRTGLGLQQQASDGC